MNKRIQQILSDSTITNVAILKDQVTVNVRLYTGETVEAVFNKVHSLHLNYGWNGEESVESLVMSDESSEIESINKKLDADKVSYLKLFDFRFAGAFNNIVLELIAENVSINGSKITV